MHKELLYESSYLEAFFHKNDSYIEFVWLPKTLQMSDKEYITEAEKQLELIEKQGVDKIFVDGKNFNYIIVPKIQTKVDREITTKYNQVGVKKIAYFQPDEAWTEMSVLQLLSEKNARQILSAAFQNRQNAIDWLLE